MPLMPYKDIKNSVDVVLIVDSTQHTHTRARKPQHNHTQQNTTTQQHHTHTHTLSHNLSLSHTHTYTTTLIEMPIPLTLAVHCRAELTSSPKRLRMECFSAMHLLVTTKLDEQIQFITI